MTRTPHVVAFVFARGGSKGVARKNLREVGGVSLLERAVRTAQASSCVSRVIVSTEDEEIAERALLAGAEVPFRRPAALADDRAPEWRAWQHALAAYRELPDGHPLDVFLSVPPTAPLRSAGDLDACVRALLEDHRRPPADAVITVTPSTRSPYYNLVRLDAESRVWRQSGAGRPERRQDAGSFYDVTTVAYAVRPSHVERAAGLFDGTVRAVDVPRLRALDVDTELDLLIADRLSDLPREALG